jgi:transcription elongation factor Elf1
MVRQVKIKDSEGYILGGILVDDDPDNAFVICGCCGSIFPMDEEGHEDTFQILEIYPDWINISDAIRGDT